MQGKKSCQSCNNFRSAAYLPSEENRKEGDAALKYIAEPNIEPVGYDGLPYGYFDRKTRKTDFTDKDRFSLLLKCNGKTELDLAALLTE